MIRVVSENGETLPELPQANPDLVAHLERLLTLARDGQITSIAFVALGPHKMDKGYAGIEEPWDGVLMLGNLCRLERMVQERTDTLSAPVVEFIAP